MRNLQVIRGRHLDFKSNISGYCTDYDTGTIYVLNVSRQLLIVPRSSTNLQHCDIAIVSIQNLPEDINIDTIKLMEFVVEESGILIALENGQLIFISLDTNHSACIYNHSRRIVSVSMSPAQDFIIVADVENTIKLLPFPISHGTKTYESNALHQVDSLHKPVGVGWGSKETQFFGLDGRPSQDKSYSKSAPSTLSTEDLSLIDQINRSPEFRDFSSKRALGTSLAIRGDGQYLATLTYIPESKKHYLKVWNRRLELQYISEQLVDIESGIISYIPSGCYICCAQNRDQQVNEVTLFEKNGLVRDRITLPNMKNLHIQSLSWSTNSSILALIARQFYVEDGQVKSDSLLLLFTMQNWHYYLKFTQRLSEEDYSLSWHPNNVNILQIMSSNGQYIEYSCNFTVDYSSDNSTVAVLDGSKVLITPLSHCVIAPPYSAIQLETTSPIQTVAINYKDSCNLCLITYENYLICTSSNSTGCTIDNQNIKPLLKVNIDERLANSFIKEMKMNYSKFNSYRLPDDHKYQHLTPINPNELVASRTVVGVTELVYITTELNKLQIDVKRKFDDSITCISRSLSPGKTENLLITLHSSSSLVWFIETNEFQPIHSLMHPENISIIDSYILNSQPTNSVITLSQDLCLRFNQHVIVFNSCTSFRITENFLVYTTAENMLCFILLDNLKCKNDESNIENWNQPIEIGGILITASESESKVVLQMPRGNLETLHPRPLLFTSLTNLLEEEKYVEAAKSARRHRVNMNFLVDYLLTLSQNSDILTKFASEIASYDPNLLCLILTELDNSYTITGRYKDLFKQLPVKPELKKQFKEVEELSKNKVNLFCSSICLPTEHRYLNPKLQALIRMEPKQMSEALKLVYELNDEQKGEALKFILYFIDIDQLFRDALCTYDTNITLMVASVSNKDPKQYLSFLDKLNEIEDSNLRCYTVDMHIKQYERAFDHLLKYLNSSKQEENVFNQIIDLVTSKKIYKHAVRVLEGSDARHDLNELIWLKYAEYLFEKRYFNEACLAYSKAQSYTSDNDYISLATKCLSLIDEWEKLIAMIARATVDDRSKQNSLKYVASHLNEAAKFHEALAITSKPKNLIDDTELSNMISKGSWYLSEFIASDEQRLTVRDLIRQSVEDLFQERLEIWLGELSTAKDHFSRLKTLLSTDRSKQLSNLEVYSDSSSTTDGSEISSEGSRRIKAARSGVTSIKTRQSVASTKPRQKRLTLKPGSRHEDIALIVELRNFFSKQKPNHVEAIRILSASHEYSTYETAQASSKTMNKLLSESLSFVQEACESLWPDSPHMDQNYSLYERKDYIEKEIYENLDFEILIKPTVPKALISFDL